jgi:hypothetical protein
MAIPFTQARLVSGTKDDQRRFGNLQLDDFRMEYLRARLMQTISLLTWFQPGDQLTALVRERSDQRAGRAPPLLASASWGLRTR